MSIKEAMAAHHRHCDELFVKAESAVAADSWVQGTQDFALFQAEIEQHFTQEEGILFPEFEALTGMTMGPTQMMRSEHVQMRQLFSDMQTALTQQDKDQYLGLSETLMMIMQQHNMKEEQILYPMTDQAFADKADDVVQRMNLM